ncbi:MAG: carbonic anhydrase [Candidatus Marinimicrobia bacterium]|nr:carbonic anhydrase [Candidatus Neomarinimicrobiota bacterium]
MASQFATVINCMDGRVQDPVNEWMKQKTGATYIDVITEAGPDRIMASTATASRLILQRILVSRDKHGSKTLALVAHYDCAGNPVSKAEHLTQLRKASKIMETWNLGMHILLIWLDENWQVEIIDEINS